MTKKPTRGSVPETVKAKVTTEATKLIETALKPKHVLPPSADQQFNYIIDIYGKWHQRYFYFYALYRIPQPEDTQEPTFEVKCARIEHTGDNLFNLSFPRYTGQWVELYPKVSLDECLTSIRNEPFFFPE